MTITTWGRRLRISVAAILLAVGAAGAGLLGSIATANAADQYVVVAVGFKNDNPPVVSVGGMSVGTDEQQTGINALANCQNSGGNQCVLQASAKNGCAAAAANDYGEVKGANGSGTAANDVVLTATQNSAMGMLENKQGAHVVVSGCTNPTQPPPSQPPAPKLGPTVSWDVILGGLEAHITDRSGVTSQCTYTTDNFNRSFALPANSTYDLRIVPAVPRFRDWTVTITCDNGTSTTVTHYF